jgi:ABC-type cobalt transport system substrate-binding protein
MFEPPYEEIASFLFALPFMTVFWFLYISVLVLGYQNALKKDNEDDT